MMLTWRERLGWGLLLLWWVGIVVASGVQPRLSRLGCFTLIDYGLMLCIPLGSWLTARFCPWRPLHFLYGVVTSSLFLDLYASDNLCWMGPSTPSPLRIVLTWLVISISVGCACRWIAFHCARPRCRPGYCHECDYDLTGNVSGICPECGSPLPKQPEQESTL